MNENQVNCRKISNNTDRNIIQCKLCRRIFSKICHLGRHVRSYSCKLITSQFTDFKNESVDATKRTPSLSECEVIKKVSRKKNYDPTNSYLNDVEAKSSQFDTETFECGICFRTFTKSCYLAKHLNAHHRKLISNSVKDKPKQKMYKCKYCKKRFKKLLKLIKHAKFHSDESNVGCDNKLIENNIKAIDDKIYGNSPINLVNQDEIHCVKTNLNSMNFQSGKKRDERVGQTHYVHKINEDSSEEKNPCKHIVKNIPHRKKYKHVCEFCNKVFKQNTRLIIHMRTHTGEKPFECRECNKKFSYSNSFNTHLKKAHKRVDTKDNIHPCDICSEEFNIVKDLFLHLQTHTDTKQSSSFYYNKYILKRRLCKCPYCSKDCHNPYNLITHLRIHTGDKPFSCRFCDSKCTTKGNLKKHLKIKHFEKMKMTGDIVAQQVEM